MTTLDVRRLGHLNVFAANHEPLAEYYRRALGAEVFADFEAENAGARNSLWSVGATCVEFFTPRTPDGPVGRWVTSHGPGWHSLEWTVPSLGAALDVLAERGIRTTEVVEGSYAFTHPADGHGLCLELTDQHFPDDPRDVAPGPVAGSGPGLTGAVTVNVASHDPEGAAAWLADLTGAAVVAEEHVHLNTRAAGVDLTDHDVRFVTPLAGIAHDPLGNALREKGERVYSATFGIADLHEARRYLAARDVRFKQFGSTSLYLYPDDTAGAQVELRVHA